MMMMRMVRGQRLMIGNTTILIDKVGESAVRLGIVADKALPIIREEEAKPPPDKS